MATSIRGTADSCLGVSGRISIREDVFGYIWGPMNRPLSVKRHLNLIKGTAFNLSLILVGHETDFSGEFTVEDTLRMQAAVDVMRELYAQVGLGVRKLYWLRIPSDEADGHEVVDYWESTDLTWDWSGDNDGIDVFIVTEITDAGGWSTENGPCDKNWPFGKSGAVMELKGSDNRTGRLMAHEVGHYLGLAHGTDITNVMGTDADNDGRGETDSRSTGLTSDQGDIMKSHCSIRSSC